MKDKDLKRKKRRRNEFQPDSGGRTVTPLSHYRMGQALTASEAEEFMREADLNGDGKLDYDEFARIMSQSISKRHSI